MSTLLYLALLLGSLRMPYPEIRSLILGVSDTLTDQMLEQLLKYLPKREEMDSLAPYKNKISELSDAEQFAVVVRGLMYSTHTLIDCTIYYVHVRIIWCACCLCM